MSTDIGVSQDSDTTIQGPVSGASSDHRPPRHLGDAVRYFAEVSGNSPAVTFLDYGIRRGSGTREGGTATTLTYAQLDRRARAVAAELQFRCAPGARVAVLCRQGLDYVVAFLACDYAGVVAVPLYAPESMRANDRLSSAMGDCLPTCVLTTTTAHTAVAGVLDRMDRKPSHVIDVDVVAAGSGAAWRRRDLPPGSPACLQYTSGSTRTPAGVRVTRENMAVAVEQLYAHFPAATVVSWLPFFHDFGLICGIVAPLSAGAHAVHLSPMAFIQDPSRWLRAISDHRADWSVTPPSTLLHCVRRVTEEQKRTLDLSCLRTISVAAEPVYAEVTEAFAAAFASCGMAPAVPTPCYGLAEATLPVTGTPVGEGVTDRHIDRVALGEGRAVLCAAGAPGAVRLVDCGPPHAGVTVRIVDPGDNRAKREGEVGEIWVSGPNVADGYWGRPERSAEVFAGRLLNPDGTESEGSWLRTGDLGFLLDGRLHVAGRVKDLIIIRGRNHYPEDIESTVLAASPVDSAAAFAVKAGGGDADAGTGGAEHLIVLIESTRETLDAGEDERREIVQSLRSEISRHHGLIAHDVIMVRRGALPRTTSGKVRRGACREMYLRGEFGQGGR
ncbi:fatty acyl-AMP ligase [Sinosporangium siamense]|uniref:Fatty-acid--CoA ligase n=1 Tax=Sinosporangium siamense TaxID=1367973 RepID=A0A919RB30_9ACTN|nr:fatty acyl-AMP ligase [Sinosporangium siamense]GII90681.1 fatty-acid--CoA ligase [Sinosporangium siamense]